MRTTLQDAQLFNTEAQFDCYGTGIFCFLKFNNCYKVISNCYNKFNRWNYAKHYCCFCYPTPFFPMRAWWKTMEPQKPGKFPSPGPEVVYRKKVAKERAAQRFCSWTGLNEMKSVFNWIPLSLHIGFSILSILESKNLTNGCVRCSEDWRGHSQRDEKAQVFQEILRGSASQKI